MYATKASDVCDLIVEGQVLLRHRRLTTLDELAIEREALQLRHQIIDRLGAMS